MSHKEEISDADVEETFSILGLLDQCDRDRFEPMAKRRESSSQKSNANWTRLDNQTNDKPVLEVRDAKLE